MVARRVDQRVLGAGTTARFWLLLVVLTAASAVVISDFFNVNADPHGDTFGCALAAGLDPNNGLNNMVLPLLAGEGALKTCVAHYVSATPWWSPVLGLGLLAGVAGVFFWGMSAWKGRRSQVVELRDADVHGDLVPALWELVQAARLARAPRFVINRRRLTSGAVVFGRPGRYTVCLDAGLVVRRQTDPYGFRAVVLHELAHIRNRDVTITYATIALWRAFLIVLLVPQAVLLGWTLIADAHAFDAAAERPAVVQNLLLFAALTVLVYLTRADILRNREIYADLDALAWGADPSHWPDTGAKGRRLFASFLELWRSHPRWDLRKQSLTDPVVLFGVQPLPVFLTGVATIILGGQVQMLLLGVQAPGVINALSPSSWELEGLTAWLTSVPITLITGVALWRAVTHAVLTGRRPPSGVRTGLWLGTGLVVGELVLGRSTGNQWFPDQPEVLVVPVLIAVVIAWWTAQCAELFVRGWRGRALRPAMLLGLAVPWLAFTFWFSWWQSAGSFFATGSSVNFAYQLQTLERLFPAPSTGHSGAIAVIAPIDSVLLTLRDNPVIIWVATALWLVPLLAWTVRPTTKVPHWVRKAMPDAADPPPPSEPLPSLRTPLRAALLGGEVGAVAVVIVMAYQHTWQPPDDQRAGLYILVYSYLLTLALAIAPVTAAAVTALIVRRYRLLVAMAAAGVAALVAFAAAFLLCATDGCLGPLNTMASTCQWRPMASWGLLTAVGQWIMPTVLGLGMFVAATVVLLIEALRRRAKRGRPGDSTEPIPSRPPRWAARRVGIATIWAAAIGLAVAGSGPLRQGSVSPLNVDQAVAAVGAPPVAPEIRRIQIASWLKYGGLNIIKRFFDDDVGKLNAVAMSLDPAKIGPVCTEFNQAPQSASAYFPVPDPALQTRWSMLINYVGQASADCRQAVRQGNKDLFVAAVIKLLNVEQVALPVVKTIASAGHV